MTDRLRILRAALGGDLFGNSLLTATIGHPPRDRGTHYRELPGVPNGLWARVYNGNGLSDDLAAKDRALEILGERPAFLRERDTPPDLAELRRRDAARRRAEAQERAEAEWRQRKTEEMWRAGWDPRGTPAADFYRSRGLDIDDGIACTALRFHHSLRFGEGMAPVIMAPLREIGTGRLRGLHRTGLDREGRKIGRKMFGVAMGCAVMLDRLQPGDGFLTVGEGVETTQTARQHLNLKPAWALGSSGAIAALPLIDGVHTLIVLAENDASGASLRALDQVGERWRAAGRNVEVIWPPAGAKDLNDLVREDAPACL